jgi:methyl-accepting chemotaxis protein
MNWFRNLQVATKLLVGFGVVLALIAALGAAAMLDLAAMARNTQGITEKWMPGIATLAQINSEAANLRIQELRAVTATSAEGVQSHLREAEGFIQAIAQLRPEYEKAIANSEERALWNSYSTEWQQYMDLHGKVLALLQAHQPADAMTLLGGQGKTLFDEARSRLEQDLKFNLSGARSATAASVSIYHSAWLLVSVLILVALLVGVCMAVALGRAIRRPLEDVIGVFRSICAGKLDNPIDTSRRDEIGVVQTSLADMQRQLRKLVAENQGQLAAIDKAQAVIEFELDGTIRSANERFLQAVGYSLAEIRGQHHSLFVEPHERTSAAYQQFWEKLRRGEFDKGRYVRLGKNGHKVWLDASYNPILDADGKPYKVVKYANDVTTHVRASQQMEQAVGQTQQAIKAATEGDLTVRVGTEDKNGDLRKMAESINSLLVSMGGIVRNVKIAADEVYRGAEEISQGNASLSQRTEEQSSSLEETASSMEEMTATVRQNADRAAEANQLAVAARDQADRGGAVTSRAVNAMDEINSASQRIADIIRVIDDIAFQTNLLALNAAVEAARAGEQGRGFAVVASEVRNLAGRSATAAKEVKELIQDSVRKVEDGSALVTQSGEALDHIVTSIKKVSDIVAEIAAASREQSAGIEQVNQAVGQMDQMTQQNAALVEEATAASQAMATQARDLNAQMAGYRVDDGAAVAFAGQALEPAPRAERRSVDRPWAAAQPAKRKAPAAVTPAAPAAPKPTTTAGTEVEWQEF